MRLTILYHFILDCNTLSNYYKLMFNFRSSVFKPYVHLFSNFRNLNEMRVDSLLFRILLSLNWESWVDMNEVVGCSWEPHMHDYSPFQIIITINIQSMLMIIMVAMIQILQANLIWSITLLISYIWVVRPNLMVWIWKELSFINIDMGIVNSMA